MIDIYAYVDGIYVPLDLKPDFSGLALTYLQSDIKEIGAKKMSYSLGFQVEDTDTNFRIFKSIANFNFKTNGFDYDEVFYDPNKKLKCQVKYDGILIFNGFLRLTSISYADDRTITYNLELYDWTKALSDQIKDKYISELDWSASKHTWNYQNIVNSWNVAGQYPYYYPLIDYGNNWTYDNMNGINTGGTSSPTYSVGYLKIKDFKPALYIKSIWDNIFDTAGFTYESNFLNGTTFSNLIMPSVTDKIINQFTTQSLFKVSLLSTPTYSVTPAPYRFIDDWIPSGVNHNGQILLGNITSVGSGDSDLYLGYNQTQKWVGGSNSTITTQLVNAGDRQGKIIGFTDETTDSQIDNQDPYNLWNTTSYVYTAPSTAGYETKQRFIFNIDLWTKFRFQPNDRIQIALYREINPYTGITSSYWANGLGYPISHTNNSYLSFEYYGDQTTNNAEGSIQIKDFPSVYSQLVNLAWYNGGSQSSFIRLSGISDYLDNRTSIYNAVDPTFKPLIPGERVRLVLRWLTSVGGYLPSTIPTGFTGAGGANVNNIPVANRMFILGGTMSFSDICYNGDATLLNYATYSTTFIPNTNFYNDISTELLPGGTVDFSKNIAVIKQSDFIDSVSKLFNLCFEPSKDYPNHFKIEPRNDYLTNNIKDWSNKVNTSDAITRQVLAETQNKITNFTYKEDSDLLNKKYKDKYDNVYSRYSYQITTNEFLVDTKEINVIFSASPLTKLKPFDKVAANNFTITQFLPDSSGSTLKLNPRILYRYAGNGYQLNKNNLIYIFDEVNKVPYTITKYPYAGTFDDPYLPGKTLDFATPNEIYFQPQYYSNINLVNMYWKDQLDELSSINSELITCKMYLDAYDISNFKFSDLIYISLSNQNLASTGDYFRVNSIKGYDPYTQLCEVELIRASKVNVTISYPGGNNNALAGNIAQSTNAASYLTTTPPNGNALMANNSNNISGSAVVIGSNNNSYSNTIINGNLNNIAGNSQVNIIGNSNIAGFNTSGIIQGNNNKILDGVKNVIILGDNIEASTSNSVLTTNPVIDYFNLISAGRNEVLDPFTDGSTINIISAGKDNIIDYAKDVAINYISGSSDKIL